MSQDLQGRVCLVTGANTGIGEVTALELARRGAFVYVACRSRAKTEGLLAAITEAVGPDRAAFVPLDLGDLDSVRACAAAVEADGRPLHILVANAGLAGQKGITTSGFELAFGVNHVGHALLVRLLLNRLRDAGTPQQPARVVIVASRAHARMKVWDLSNVQQPTATTAGLPEYGRSKLANIYFARALHRRIQADPAFAGRVNVYSLHPGVVASDIWRKVPAPVRWVMKLFMVSVEDGAKTQLHCATSPDVVGESGLYYDLCKPRSTSSLALNDANADDLWTRTAGWIGLPEAI